MKNYDILIIREYFPSSSNPSSSMWVFNQVEFLNVEGNLAPIVVSPTPYVPKFIKYIFGHKHHWKNSSKGALENYKGIEIFRPQYIKLPNKYFLIYNLFSGRRAIQIIARKLSIKIAHAHYGHAGVMIAKYSFIKKIPLIVSFYGYDLGSDKNRLAAKYQYLAKVGSLFLVLSNDMAQDLIDLGFPENKIVIHHIGVDTNNFTYQNPEIKPNKFIFTTVCNFEERKGVQFVIKAFKKLSKHLPLLNLELRIVGDGYYKKVLFELAKGWKKIVFINNYIQNNPRKTVLDEIKLANVFVLASFTMPNGEKEGTPVVLLEAQSCGKPCISTIHAGIPEEVIHDYTGKLVKEKDVEDIFQQMLFLVMNPSQRIKMGENARKHILNEFDNDRQNLKLLNLYEKLLNN